MLGYPVAATVMPAMPEWTFSAAWLLQALVAIRAP
jgi:hypothetical protein